MSDEVSRRIGLRTLAVVVLWLALAMICGRVTFAPWATGLLVAVTGRTGIYGTEAVEDFYMVVSLIVALVVAIAIVLLIERAIGRSRLTD